MKKGLTFFFFIYLIKITGLKFIYTYTIFMFLCFYSLIVLARLLDSKECSGYLER